MFSYKEFLQLKKRDFELWAWRAQKALIEKEMLFANTIRIAIAKQDQYSRFFDGKQIELARLDGKVEDLYRQTWQELKMRINRG